MLSIGVLEVDKSDSDVNLIFTLCTTNFNGANQHSRDSIALESKPNFQYFRVMELSFEFRSGLGVLA